MDPRNPRMVISLWHKECPLLPKDWDGDLPEYKLIAELEEDTPYAFIYQCELCGTKLYAGYSFMTGV